MSYLVEIFKVEDIRELATELSGHYIPASITQRMFSFLEPEQEIAYRWNRGLFGGFWTRFLDNIHSADSSNIRQLFKAFPVEVAAMRMFYTVGGWYEEVEKLVHAFENK